MAQLEESKFIRHLLFEENQPRWRRYASLVISQPSVRSLASYEVRVALFGSVSGALGVFLRQKMFRRLFKSVGRNVVIGRDVTIRHGEKIALGDNVVLDDRCVIDGRGADADGITIGDNTIVGRNSVVQSKVGALHIGANVNIGADSAITSQGGLVIDDWAQVAGGCKISGGRFKLDPEMRDGTPFKRLTTGPVRIGKVCFLGPGAIVNDGASVGNYSVIGPGAVVMSNVPDYGVFMARPGMLMGSTAKTE